MSLSDSEKALHSAIISGDFDKVSEAIVRKGADPRRKIYTTQQGSALHLACRESKSSYVVAFLLNWCGIDVNDLDANDETPLHEAIKKGKLSHVKILLQARANVNAENKEGCTPLLCAAVQGNYEVLECVAYHGDLHVLQKNLVQGGDDEENDDDLNVMRDHCLEFKKLRRSQHLEYKLRDAARLGDLRSLERVLVKHRSLFGLWKRYSVDAKSLTGCTALHYAVKAGANTDIKVMGALIKAKASINARNDYDSTPLHLTARYGTPEAVQILISKKAEVNARDTSKRTPLLRAVENKRHSHEICEILVMAKADINARDAEGTAIRKIENMYLQAAHRGDCPMVESLLRRRHGPTIFWNKFDMEAQCSAGLGALHLAVKQNQTDVLRTLINIGGLNVNQKTQKSRMSPLHFAAKFGALESAKCLLGRNVNYNAIDSNGWTPLMIAAGRPGASGQQLACMLLDAKADFWVTDKEGRSALDIASAQGTTLLVQRVQEILFERINEAVVPGMRRIEPLTNLVVQYLTSS